MDEFQLRLVVSLLEVLTVLLITLLTLFFYLLRKNLSVKVLVFIKGFMILFYSLGCSYATYQLAHWLEISKLATWISVSISVLLGAELLHLNLSVLTRKGNNLAKKLLDI